MTNLKLNTFSSFDLTDEEERQGSMLSITQKQSIQNKIAVIAEEKINLEIPINITTEFIQQEAGLRGQMQSLQYLLECSTYTEVAIEEEAKDPNTFIK